MTACPKRVDVQCLWPKQAPQPVVPADAPPVAEAARRKSWRVVASDGPRGAVLPAPASVPQVSEFLQVQATSTEREGRTRGSDIHSGGTNAPPISPKDWDIDSRLARVIEAWPTLPRAIQAAILAMISCKDEG
jgi:hypothetical protein